MKKGINIQDVIEIVRLVKKVNCQHYALVTETARELGVKKTDLMLYIEQNPKLFKVKETKRGLAIEEAYSAADLNPATEEWIARMKKEWDRKLHVDERTYYNIHQYWHFPVEYTDDSRRYHLWRNTPEKFKELEEAGILNKVEATYGGFPSDIYREDVYLVDTATLKRLEDAGWKTDFNEVAKV